MLKVEFYDPAVLLLDTYSREMKVYVYGRLVHKCSQEHFFIIAKKKKRKYP
jgi:hypothetical protein